MKIVTLIYQIIQEKFAYGELFMLVMIGYIFMFEMVKKNPQISGLEIVAGLTRPLIQLFSQNLMYTQIITFEKRNVKIERVEEQRGDEK